VCNRRLPNLIPVLPETALRSPSRAKVSTGQARSLAGSVVRSEGMRWHLVDGERIAHVLSGHQGQGIGN
jgi:hypothetical protein